MRWGQSAAGSARESATDELADVPAAVVCAFCGQPDCQGCGLPVDEPTHGSGVMAIIPWERPGLSLLTRWWSTAHLATLNHRAFFSALPEGSWRPALTFALLAMPAEPPAPEPLPAPTGPHRTGRASFHWKDAAREELETSAPGDKRELMVHLFYPADAKASGSRAAYMPDADAMRGVWNDAQLAQVISMRALSIETAPLPSGDARYPVVIFAPGGGIG